MQVLSYLAAFEGLVEPVSIESKSAGAHTVYRIKEIKGNVQLYKFSIGPIEIAITYDSMTTGLVVEAFINLPFLPTISVGKVGGSLMDGVGIKLGYKGILSGEIKVAYRDGHAYLGYEFTVAGASFDGELQIF
ncbi:hypothetical protein D9756_010984 [Leucocoprinus leucothites]|uniref:Uncharacterized protein n=1 Tax=Leucocoprinus leucothites TaxID=201217 RepID=A0A8H5CP79_9AGAR|nr:hypothetical protein D9756_010984 [Leucoagaricus leucothites]